MARRYYTLLGVSSRASGRDIKRAYLKLARRLHPDLNPGDREAAERYREIFEAFKILSDRSSRELYDRRGKVAAPAGAGAAGGAARESRGWETLAGEIFGEGAPEAPEAAAVRGEDIYEVLEISFAESLSGTVRECRVSREGPCPRCGGSRFDPDGRIDACPDCDGAGLVALRRGPWTVKRICRRCGGGGEVGETPCAACGGRGTTRARETVSLTVPPGSDTGTRLMVPGRGQPGRRGGAPGDLVVTLKVQPHPALERRGYNLFCEVAVPLSKAVLGGRIRVPAAEGIIPVRVPMGAQCGQELRLKGRGVPLPDGERGDLYVKLSIRIPSAEDPGVRRVFTELREIEDGPEGGAGR